MGGGGSGGGGSASEAWHAWRGAVRVLNRATPPATAGGLQACRHGAPGEASGGEGVDGPASVLE